MGHIAGKDIYRKLGKKIDNLAMRAPWNEAFHAILKELYSTEEADIIVKMPYGLSKFDKVEKITKYESSKLRKILNGLCSKGLMMDLCLGGEYYYMPSPIIIGIFEFTMMRTGHNLNSKKWAKLFHEYLQGDYSFWAANFDKDKKISPLRTLPHEEAVDKSEYVEILDYEKATSIIENAKKFCIGICSCRHEKFHVGEKNCEVPLDTCSSFDGAADYLIKHNLGKEVSKTEMLENLARSREMGLVFCADNVKKDITFICHCCGCCCNVMLGINKFGYPNILVTSSYIAEMDKELCARCGTCVESCPINAIEMLSEENPIINEPLCIGCGVCGLKCQTGAIKLTKRKQRVLHPEDTFERVVLQCLERGTLQNQMFSNPQSITHKFMRGIVGAFLKLPPVKKSLMSDTLRSSFLSMMKKKA